MTKTKAKRGPGRPWPAGPRRTRSLPAAKVTPDELARYEAAAAEAGLKLSAWVREACDQLLTRGRFRAS